LNPAAFTANPIGTYGNLGRNAVRGPGNVNVDVALSRNFKFDERYTLQLRADSFNIANHPNFVGAIFPAGTGATSTTTLDNNLSSSTFGRSRTAFDPRIIQFAVKLYF
jgi:hypothetical protein